MNVYVLIHHFDRDKYYICDMHGTLSKNEEDAMIFFDAETALRYQGLQENLFEKQTGQISRIHILEVDERLFSRRIYKALSKQISCLGNNDKSSDSI